MKKKISYPSIVRVIKGEFLGNIGYYDDDSDDGAIVYFGEPLLSEYDIIPHEFLELADVKHFATEKLIKKYPRLAEILGI